MQIGNKATADSTQGSLAEDFPIIRRSLIEAELQPPIRMMRTESQADKWRCGAAPITRVFANLVRMRGPHRDSTAGKVESIKHRINTCDDGKIGVSSLMASQPQVFCAPMPTPSPPLFWWQVGETNLISTCSDVCASSDELDGDCGYKSATQDDGLLVVVAGVRV